jgi:hypothetical protein
MNGVAGEGASWRRQPTRAATIAAAAAMVLLPLLLVLRQPVAR